MAEFRLLSFPFYLQFILTGTAAAEGGIEPLSRGACEKQSYTYPWELIPASQSPQCMWCDCCFPFPLRQEGLKRWSGYTGKRAALHLASVSVPGCDLASSNVVGVPLPWPEKKWHCPVSKPSTRTRCFFSSYLGKWNLHIHTKRKPWRFKMCNGGKLSPAVLLTGCLLCSCVCSKL